jgi:uncharacterized protein YciI
MPIDEPSASTSRDPVFYVLFLSLIPGKMLTSAVVDRHATHLADVDREGKLVLAGPLLTRFGGLIVLRVPSLAEATAIAEADPMIRGGFQSYELATWMIANKQNHYRPTTQLAGKQ